MEELRFLQGLQRKKRAGRADESDEPQPPGIGPLGKLQRKFGHALATLTNLGNVRGRCERWGERGYTPTPPVAVINPQPLIALTVWIYRQLSGQAWVRST